MRRRYGKPLPPKKQVQAHLDFYAQVNEGVKMAMQKVYLTDDEKKYLHRLISSDWHTMIRNMDHALCYGVEVVLQDEIIAAGLINKIQNAE